MSNTIEKSITGALEAVLFAMGSPVEITTIAKALDTDLVAVLDAAEELKKIYNDANRGISLIELDGRLQLCTKSCYYENLIRIAATPEKPSLTNTLMETLAIVAYKQPVTKAEITKIRGVSSDHAVNRLVEYGLIEEAGRLNAPGRPILFATTEEFLRRFGMSSLEGLPDPETAKKEEETHEDTVIDLFAGNDDDFGDGGEIYSGDSDEGGADIGGTDFGEVNTDLSSENSDEGDADGGNVDAGDADDGNADDGNVDGGDADDGDADGGNADAENSDAENPDKKENSTESTTAVFEENLDPGFSYSDESESVDSVIPLPADLNLGSSDDEFTDEELDALIRAGALDDLAIIDDYHDEMVDKIFSEITHMDDENIDDDDV